MGSLSLSAARWRTQDLRVRSVSHSPGRRMPENEKDLSRLSLSSRKVVEVNSCLNHCGRMGMALKTHDSRQTPDSDQRCRKKIVQIA